MLTESIKLVADVGVSVALSAVTIYIIFEYFRMKRNVYYLKYKKYQGMLRPDVVEHIVSAEVWSHSRSKLQMIKSILIANHLKGREEEVKLKIQNLLERQSDIYIDWFNTLNTPIERLGDFYTSVFDFDEFLSEVMKVVFRDNLSKIPKSWKGEKFEYYRTLLIVEQIEDISNIMIKFQTKANTKIAIKLREIDKKLDESL